MINSNFIPHLENHSHKTVYTKWNSLNWYIQSYLMTHPLLSHEIKINLLSFRTQYLAKIADLEKNLCEKKIIPMTPYSKADYSYQRGSSDNNLFNESIAMLKNVWQNEYIHFCSNVAYLYELKTFNLLIHIKNENEIEVKLNKKLELIDFKIKDSEFYKKIQPEFNLKEDSFHLYFLFDVNPHQPQDAIKKQVELFKQTALNVISNYPFSSQNYNELVKNSLYWTIILPSANKDIHCSISNTTFFGDRICYAGSTPTIQQTARIYARSFPYQNKIVGSLPSVIQAHAQNTLISPIFPLKLKDLLRNSLEYLLCTWGCKSSAGERILLEGTLHLIEGLFFLNIEHKFLSYGIYDLLYQSAQRINQYTIQLQSPMSNWTFESTIDLIIEEITLLLTLSKPYKQGELESALINNLVYPWPTPSLVRVNQSGMQCFVEIVHGLRKTYKDLAPNEDINVLYFDDIYFECNNFFEDCNCHQDFQQPPYINFHRVPTNNERSFYKKLNLLQDKKVRIDALFIDLHSAPKLQNNYQNSHDVVNILQFFQSNHMLKPNFACCIDNTIGMWGSQEIHMLLNTFRQEIENGILHFIIYRSSHKFDILGCDKFNGGSYVVYSHPESNLYKCLQKTPSSATANHVDYQMYTHFYKHAHKSIKKYYREITKNTQILFDKMDNSLIFTHLKPKSLWVVKKEDPLTSYFNVCYTSKLNIFNYLKNRDPNLDFVHIRNSFGYRTTSLSSLEQENFKALRITVGIESIDRLTQLAEFFNNAFLEINKQYDETNLSIITNDTDCIEMDLET